LLNDFDAEYSFIDNDGSWFWFRTDLDAPRGRVIAIDLSQPERSDWKEVIPQNDEPLKGISMVNDQFIVSSLQDAHSRARIYSREGKELGEIALPGLGSAGGFNGKRTDRETFYFFTSFTSPGTIYRYDLVTRASSLFRKPKLDFDASPYETHQVFYKSKDGARIPMYLTHRRNIKLDGKNPALLYGYGGFNISLAPAFSVANAAWLEMGGVYAMANLRGGGEYGEDWHKAGMKTNKQNVFDDFLAAARWLEGQRYTEPSRLGISGRSNGGLLVGASMTQHPELFAVALPGVGVMDMLRFQKFTIGWAWTSDYGSADKQEDFAALYAYSPYHRLKPGTSYPATLVTTADHDDRVFPAHSFKFAARLQECQAGDKPVLIRIETRAGHGAGKPTAKIIEETADQLAFLQLHLIKNHTATGEGKTSGK
jgi:prolyl oligopeptidase